MITLYSTVAWLIRHKLRMDLQSRLQSENKSKGFNKTEVGTGWMISITSKGIQIGRKKAQCTRRGKERDVAKIISQPSNKWRNKSIEALKEVLNRKIDLLRWPLAVLHCTGEQRNYNKYHRSKGILGSCSTADCGGFYC